MPFFDHVTVLALVAVLGADGACKQSSAESSRGSPVAFFCVGPAGPGFDPRIPLSGLPSGGVVPRKWWDDAVLIVQAAGCHPAVESIVGAPRVSRSGADSWLVDGYFTVESAPGVPSGLDCAGGHYGYHLGWLAPGHHSISAGAATLAFQVPVDRGTPTLEKSDGIGSPCAGVPAASLTGPTDPPGDHRLIPVFSPTLPQPQRSHPPVPPRATLLCPYGVGDAGANDTELAYDKHCGSAADCAIGPHYMDCCGTAIELGINKREASRFSARAGICGVGASCKCASAGHFAEDGHEPRDFAHPDDVAVTCVRGMCVTYIVNSGGPTP